FLSLTFRYLTCLLDKGHITDRGGYFCGLLVSLPNVYPAQKQVMPKLITAIKSKILIGLALLSV
ncbi:hypothetical protein LI294_24625, partial [bacterium 210702-DFI.5.13]|nr:hypothetical protein [bacterium 210702-DFI.5.13]